MNHQPSAQPALVIFQLDSGFDQAAKDETPQVGVKIDQQIEIVRSKLGDQAHEAGDTTMSFHGIKLHHRKDPGIVSQKVGISSFG
jgi:hypothetical protein